MVKGHLIAVRDSNQGTARKHHLEDQSILQKKFGDYVEQGKKSVSAVKWSTRNVDWYNSERRFIFACKSKEQRKKWMRLLAENCQRMRQLLVEKH